MNTFRSTTQTKEKYEINEIYMKYHFINGLVMLCIYTCITMEHIEY